MTHDEALAVIAQHRGARVVITTMGSVGRWPTYSDTPLDFHYLPSSMGQGVALGLGLALATQRGTIVLSGDGSLLMNLGSLVTIANHSAPLTIILIDNGLYEVTGGQDIVGARRTDFRGLAQAAGIKHVAKFDSFASWTANAPAMLANSESTFIQLVVTGEHGQKTPSAPRPMAAQIARLQSALGVVR